MHLLRHRQCIQAKENSQYDWSGIWACYFQQFGCFEAILRTWCTIHDFNSLLWYSMVRFQFCNINMTNRVLHDWCEDKKGSFDTLAAAAVNFASFRQFFPAKYYFVQTIKKVTLKHHLEIAIHYKSFWISTHSNRMPLLLLWIVK